jgi:hypothetical protein
MEPELLYALAAQRTTPNAAQDSVEIEGDTSIATKVLEAVSGAARN